MNNSWCSDGFFENNSKFDEKLKFNQQKSEPIYRPFLQSELDETASQTLKSFVDDISSTLLMAQLQRNLLLHKIQTGQK